MNVRLLKHQLVSTKEKILLARRVSGKPILSQLNELIRLRFSRSGISPSEYFNFELYNDQIHSFSAKSEFVGGCGAARIYAPLNDNRWSAIARDKLLFHALMAGCGAPVPRLYAAYSRTRLRIRDTPCFHEADDLIAFLRNKIPYPFFAKPIGGAHGVGGFAFDGYDSKADQLRPRFGGLVPIRDFVSTLLETDHRGYLFQECVTPHSFTLEKCGSTLSTIRMIVFLSSTGPHLLRAIWRIPRGSNMTDNFCHGNSGNLIAQIAIESGRVVDVLQSVGMNRVAVNHHPETKQALAGEILPDWGATVKVCLECAAMLPGIRLQAWDMAISSDGPKVIEVNAHGDLDIAQYAYRAGFLDKRFRALLNE